MWLVGLYLGIGVLVAIVHLAQGKVGAVGPLGTFFAATIAWPWVLYMENR
jgi:hypothetical protein